MEWSDLKSLIEHPYPLLFLTVSGAHLYGFPSPDSDYDLRGVHILSINDVIGLEAGEETFDSTEMRQGKEVDLTTHDIRKFFSLLLKRNGYVLEQLYSPLIVHSTPGFEELKAIGKGCITRYHGYHYLGFAKTQWDLFNKAGSFRVKPLLYTYRVLLTGINLMRTGKIDANIINLNNEFKLSYIDELVNRKIKGTEQSIIENPDVDIHRSEYERLYAELETAMDESQLPGEPTARAELNDLLIRLRLS